MSRAARSAIAAAVILLLLGIVFREDSRVHSRTTFGYVPAGHGALFELLMAIGLETGRSYEAPEHLGESHTVWWIAPEEVCPEEDPENTVPQELRPEPAALDDFAERGGTALVFLRPWQPPPFWEEEEAAETPEACGSVGGFDLPGRSFLEAEPAWIEGRLVPRPRELAIRLAVFDDVVESWRVRASAAGRPFVLERELGEGRLVVVADARFLRNEWLDGADAAPLVVDLVGAYGPPLVDERQHGLRLERDSLGYLVRSPALPFFLALAALGGLVVWRGTALRPGLPAAPKRAAPTLEEFVASVATLYSRTRDHARVAERYREYAAARLRRGFGLPPETTLEEVANRMERRGRVPRARLRLLRAPTAPQTEAQLRAVARQLDQLVEEALG